MTIADINDAIIHLIADRERLELDCDAACRGRDDDAIDALVDRAAQAIAAVDERIADTIATTADGLAAQVAHLLNVVDRRGRGVPFSNEGQYYSEDWADRLVSTIAFGIGRLCVDRPTGERREDAAEPEFDPFALGGRQKASD